MPIGLVKYWRFSDVVISPISEFSCPLLMSLTAHASAMDLAPSSLVTWQRFAQE